MGTASNVGSTLTMRVAVEPSQFVAWTYTLKGSRYIRSMSSVHSGRFVSGYLRIMSVASVVLSKSTSHANWSARPPPPIEAAASTTRSPAQ